MKYDRDSILSADILLYRRRDDSPEVHLAHPGGPSYRNEELGFRLEEALPDLGAVRQKGGQLVRGFALGGDMPTGGIRY